MTRWTLVRLVLLGAVCALALAALTVLVLRTLGETASAGAGRTAIFLLARMLERGTPARALSRDEGAGLDEAGLRADLWVVSPDGAVLESNTSNPLPWPWERLPQPERIHEVRVSFRPFGLVAEEVVTRLDTPEPRYLVARFEPRGASWRTRTLRVTIPVLAAVTSGFLSLLFTFVYLRRKSREAREVLARMEQGDLKARFRVKHFDEVGSLMLDFNRMATEIERLVARIEETERTRAALLQELSHDLRTPLMSLRASADTLVQCAGELSEAHRRELLGVLQSELAYFSSLLEELFFIARMGEPRYKRTTERIDLRELLGAELQAARTQEATSPRSLSWVLELPGEGESLVMSGDPRLIRRLFRNALDNAARFARGRVSVSVSAGAEALSVRIVDDGPGMPAEQLARFGEVRSRRTVVEEGPVLRVSLGLGSVIMRTILELHRGSWRVESPPPGGEPASGVALTLVLPRA
ncbi:MAG TPA: HAMP domain-containing sensor histidine kinase [Archangium sp.]|uniref:sensor histidine kinase n=1 Tax=Archangium sp. TaxID=1872627 RepID=UPI002E2EEB00|nr:HAMP domain-containing sensor histidine kinase [Archangium sp.]HEX5752080.1 HAMP domain-containing sensor histidine kinase [Archangium sp.]